MNMRIQSVALLALTALVTTFAGAADRPIGSLLVQGQGTITSPYSTFGLSDEEYAYFGGDRLVLGEDDFALITTNDGLEVRFLPTSEVAVTRENGVYRIDLQKGGMLIDPQQAAEYQISHEGEAVPVDGVYKASDEAYVALVEEKGGEVMFYQPSQVAATQGSLAAFASSMGMTVGGLIAAAVAVPVAIVVVEDAASSS